MASLQTHAHKHTHTHTRVPGKQTCPEVNQMSKQESAIIEVTHIDISGRRLLSGPYVKTLAHKLTSGLMPAAQLRVAPLC